MDGFFQGKSYLEMDDDRGCPHFRKQIMEVKETSKSLDFLDHDPCIETHGDDWGYPIFNIYQLGGMS